MRKSKTKVRKTKVKARRPRTSITDDYEFRRLLIAEIDAIKANKDKIPLALKEFYGSIGGSVENVRSMYVYLISTYIEKKLDKLDLPGPDALYKPKILEIIKKFVGESFDEFFDL